MPVDDPLHGSNIQALVNSPREDLDIEYKSWLDLGDRPGRAILAKSLAALANHGGGFLVFGFDDETDREPRIQPQSDCEFDLRFYGEDEINGFVSSFCSLPFHCKVDRVSGPTATEHVIVSVPKDIATPVAIEKVPGAVEDEIELWAIYIRKPGPKSEPARTPAEWDPLLQRCMQARKDELVRAFREIAQYFGGEAERIVDTLEVSIAEPLEAEMLTRFQGRVSAEGNASADLYSNGHWTASVAFLEPSKVPTLPKLREALEVATGNDTGWPVFLARPLRDYALEPRDGGIERWFSDLGDDPSDGDFWRVEPDGKAFLLRGYQEDGPQWGAEPGSELSGILPIWRTGEVFRWASRMSEIFGSDRIEVRFRWSGLKGRTLTTRHANRYASPWDRVCQDEAASSSVETSVNEINNDLSELVNRTLVPLYEKFAFFEMPPATVDTEINELAQTNSGRTLRG